MSQTWISGNQIRKDGFFNEKQKDIIRIITIIIAVASLLLNVLNAIK